MTRRRTSRRHRDDRDLPRTGQETGFWDDNGRPAPWPDDIEEWRPVTHDPVTLKPGEPPF